MPILSTLYVFTAHYVAPYVWHGFALLRPYVLTIFHVVVPLLRRLSPTWIFLQWGMHAREIRIHTKAVARLNAFGSDVLRSTNRIGTDVLRSTNRAAGMFGKRFARGGATLPPPPPAR